MEKMTEAQAVVDAVKGMFKPEVVKVKGQDGQTETEILILPDSHGGLEAHSVKSFTDEYRRNPERRTGKARMLTLESLCDHINRSKNSESAVFADSDREGPSIMAVYNYHDRCNIVTEEGFNHVEKAQARFLDHRAEYAFPLSEEWKAWRQFDSETMGQAEFAEFLEERIGDVEVPPVLSEDPANDDEPTKKLRALLKVLGGKLAGPAELMELSKGLKVNADERVHNAVNLSSGESQIQYSHEHTDEKGQPLTVPNLFLINIPVFDQGDIYRVFVRLRYRVRGGTIKWHYQLYREGKVFDAAFAGAVETVKETTGLPVFIGHPER